MQWRRVLHLFNVTRALDELPWVEWEQRRSLSGGWVSTGARCADALELVPCPARWAFPAGCPLAAEVG